MNDAKAHHIKVERGLQRRSHGHSTSAFSKSYVFCEHKRRFSVDGTPNQRKNMRFQFIKIIVDGNLNPILPVYKKTNPSSHLTNLSFQFSPSGFYKRIYIDFIRYEEFKTTTFVIDRFRYNA